MSRKSKNEKKLILREETLQGVLAVLFFAAGLTLIFAAFGRAGSGGTFLYEWLVRFAGVGFYLIPILAFVISAGFLRALRGLFPVKKTIGAFVLFLSGLGMVELIFPMEGGWLGKTLAAPLVELFDIYISIVILAACFVIALLIMFEASIPIASFGIWWKERTEKKVRTKITGLDAEEVGEDPSEESDEDEDGAGQAENVEEKKVKVKNGMEAVVPAFAGKIPARPSWRPYTPPSLSLLEADKGKPGVGDIKANANIIKRTLQNFGIEVEMDEISIGPAVTRYALKPAESVRLSKIVALQRELELALAAHPIRIEAPIPGKSLVGIEIPNTVKATVGLATMLGSAEFASSEKPLLMSLGKDLSGKAHFANLSKMPHTLIAGTTGSGKSVTIHTILTSLLFRNSPDDLKLILIDPKRVELTLYNKIPHLLTPVVTEAKKAILALKWAAKEMDRRYDILESESVRDIQSYHKNIVEPEYKKLEKTAKTKKGDEEAEETTGVEKLRRNFLFRLAEIFCGVGLSLLWLFLCILGILFL